MAEERTAPAEAPTEAPAAAAPAASGGGLKPWLPLIITTLLMPALAFGMAQYVILPRLQKQLGVTTPAAATAAKDSDAKPAKDVTKEKMTAVPVNKLLVNVAGTMGARYLLVSLSVVGTGADFKNVMDDHDAQLRDMACGVLGSIPLADLEKPGERNLIRNELISGFNNILGDSTVQEIYIPEFAIQ